MESGKFLKNSQIVILGVCIAVATVLSSIILSQGFMKIMKFTKEVITVTGSAQKRITSDFAVWRGSFSRRAADLTEAYRAVRDDLLKVKSYLVSRGVSESEIVVSQIYTTTIYRKNEKGNNTNEIECYTLSQNIEVQSGDVDKITKISRESTELILLGIGFESQAPEYFYTKLDELKIEMLSKAAQNAKERAQNMAKAAGNRIGVLRSAKMGVFQITPVNSTEVSDYGVNDTSSLEKKVTAAATVSFAIE